LALGMNIFISYFQGGNTKTRKCVSVEKQRGEKQQWEIG